jgi:hypothetical protein
MSVKATFGGKLPPEGRFLFWNGRCFAGSDRTVETVTERGKGMGTVLASAMEFILTPSGLTLLFLSGTIVATRMWRRAGDVHKHPGRIYQVKRLRK